MIAPVVRDFLQERKVEFTETWHPRVATALAEAHKDHTPPSELAKTVLVRADDRFVLAAIPANCRIDWKKLARLAGTEELRLATEEEIDRVLPALETGAIPPLGPLFDMPVFLDQHLAHHEEIAFNAGCHTNTIHMTAERFCRLVQPVIGSFTA